MLWLEKHRPKSFDLMVGHERAISVLKSYDLNSVPHLIIHGMPGTGKKTLALNLIHHLYGKLSPLSLNTTQITVNSKTININFIESNEYIEVSPSDYGFRDKIIIQSIIKEMAQFRPVLSFFDNKKSSKIRIVLISSAQDLTQEAQAALRRTIEVYSECFRIILLCSQVSKIIEPIRSRCVFIRVKALKSDNVKKILSHISCSENVSVDNKIIDEIEQLSNGNIRKAICLLEVYQFKKNDCVNKRQKIDVYKLKLEWEAFTDEIAESALKTQKPDSMIEIRKKLYVLINSCIPPKFILRELYKRFIFEKNTAIVYKITNLALKYEERIKIGTKGIYHIEAFVLGCMCVFSKFI